MEQNIRQLFYALSNPHDAIRKSAEAQLSAYEKDSEFMRFVKNTLMKDTDIRVQSQASSFFKVIMEKNWKCPELLPIVTEIQNEIFNLLLIEDKYPKNTYIALLEVIFDNSEKDVILNIFKNSGKYLSSPNLAENKVALLMYEELFKSQHLKFNSDDILDIIFDQYGNIFTQKLTEFISSRKYSAAATCMKIICKAYSHYTLPDFLTRIDVFVGFFNLSLQLLEIKDNSNDSLSKVHKWAGHFLYKSCNKGLKKYFKSNDIIVFIREENTLQRLYFCFNNLLNSYVNGEVIQDKLVITIADFFCLIASNKHSRHLIKSNYMHILTSFVIPNHIYNDETKDYFENDPDSYLREKYSYHMNDLKESTNSLFEEILHCDKEIESTIIANFKAFLDNGANPSTVATRYAIIGLLASTQKSLIKQLTTNGFYDFVKNYIFADLCNTSYPFLVSQALYFLSLTQSFEITDAVVYNALSKIFELTSCPHEILAVEACLALNTFFYNDQLHQSFKSVIAPLFEKVLSFSKKYFIDSLTTLSDSIIECFTEDISAYAPIFVKTICESFLTHIQSDKEPDLNILAGYLSSIEKLIMSADDKPDIINNIYLSAYNVLFYIFSNKTYDLYQEALDLMNSFLFSMKLVNESMFNIFVLALTGDKDEICIYPREISDFIDNYLTFGKAQMITMQTLQIIYNTIDIFIPDNTNENEIYDEDFEAGCRIIDSLMLNCGQAVHQTNANIIPVFVRKIVLNYDFACTYESLPLYALECIMNCFVVNPEITLASLGQFTTTFFSQLDVNRNLFKRVYDKKLFLLFLGILYKLNTTLPIDYPAFNDTFVDILTSLPDAIKKREKLQKEAENEEYGDEENSDYEYDEIFEDIYFVTILDNFDAYEYVANMLSNIVPNSVGQHALSAMTQTHFNHIRAVLDRRSAIQK